MYIILGNIHGIARCTRTISLWSWLWLNYYFLCYTFQFGRTALSTAWNYTNNNNESSVMTISCWNTNTYIYIYTYYYIQTSTTNQQIISILNQQYRYYEWRHQCDLKWCFAQLSFSVNSTNNRQTWMTNFTVKLGVYAVHRMSSVSFRHQINIKKMQCLQNSIFPFDFLLPKQIYWT